MRSPRCARLLLLLLLPPLLLTPPAGDAAVITGVSGRGAPVHPGCAPSSCRGVVGAGDGVGTATGRWGHGRVIPARDTCPTLPLEHLEKRPDP